MVQDGAGWCRWKLAVSLYSLRFPLWLRQGRYSLPILHAESSRPQCRRKYNMYCIKMKYCRQGRYRKLPRLILCVLYAWVCVEAIIWILPSPWDTKASSVWKCTLLLSPIIAGRQRPAVPHWLWQGCQKNNWIKIWKYIQSFTTCRGSNMGFSATGFGCRTLLERANPVSSSLFSAVAATSGPAWEGSQARHQQHLLPPGRSFVEMSSRQRSGAKWAKDGKGKITSVSLSISCHDLRCHARLDMASLLWRMVRDGQGSGPWCYYTAESLSFKLCPAAGASHSKRCTATNPRVQPGHTKSHQVSRFQKVLG